MLKLDYLKDMLIISMALSTIACAFIQKTKCHFNTSKFLPLYSFAVNMLLSIIFCMTFTELNFPSSLWTGLFSFIGADTIYKALEGKMASHRDLTNAVILKKENIINEEDS